MFVTKSTDPRSAFSVHEIAFVPHFICLLWLLVWLFSAFLSFLKFFLKFSSNNFYWYQNLRVDRNTTFANILPLNHLWILLLSDHTCILYLSWLSWMTCSFTFLPPFSKLWVLVSWKSLWSCMYLVCTEIFWLTFFFLHCIF